ncbi:MAG: phosphoribosylformylglycinamidine synthase, partial [Chloroflexota bacterium]
MDRIYRVEVTPRPGEPSGDGLLADIAALGIGGVERVLRSHLYFLRGELDDAQVARICRELLADPIVQVAHWAPLSLAAAAPAGAVAVEVGLLHGVTDTVAANLVAHAHLIGATGLRAASTGQRHLLYGPLEMAQVHTIARRLLCNDVIQYYALGALAPHVGVEPPEVAARAEPIHLAGLSDVELARMSRERLLSLDLAEMRAVQAYFGAEGRDPTDVELESIAQTWSEHCNHKTFRGLVSYEEVTPQGICRLEIDSLI